MEYQNKTYCDDCGNEIDFNNLTRKYSLEEDGTDRCLGGSGIDGLQIECDIYKKFRKDSHFEEAEESLAALNYIFCIMTVAKTQIE